MSTLKSAYKAGRCFNGAHRDRGTIIHIVPSLRDGCVGDWFEKSLCGVVPGNRSFGWSESNKEPTCEKCIKKITHYKTKKYDTN